jgi:hypothetical protein
VGGTGVAVALGTVVAVAVIVGVAIKLYDNAYIYDRTGRESPISSMKCPDGSVNLKGLLLEYA